MLSVVTELDSKNAEEAFLEQVGPNQRGVGLFDHFNDIAYFAKDRAGRFVAVNEPLVLLLGHVNRDEIIGKTDFELVPSYLAEAYLKDDEKVLKCGEEIANKIELVTRNDLSVQWHSTTKIPVYGLDGNIVGLEGVTRPFAIASSALGAYPELSRVIDYVESDFAKRITVADLAELASLSLRTFERQFKKRFKISPSAYLKKVRINAACRELIYSNRTIAEIAAFCGFCDQSYMTKEFARLMQVTPQVYRDIHVR